MSSEYLPMLLVFKLSVECKVIGGQDACGFGSCDDDEDGAAIVDEEEAAVDVDDELDDPCDSQKSRPLLRLRYLLGDPSFSVATYVTLTSIHVARFPATAEAYAGRRCSGSRRRCRSSSNKDLEYP